MADGAVGVVDEGTGVDAAWQEAAAAGLPIGIVYQGSSALIDPTGRPNVFRIAPTDRGMAFRLAEHLVPKGLRLGLINDDSAYGAAGRAALDKAFSRNQSSVASAAQVPADGDPAAAVLAARSAGATALIVWARPAGVATVIQAARSRGWAVPIFSAISGEDPLVRQRLADHPDWVDGLTVAMSRLTAERGPAPFLKFRGAYEKRFGPDDVGVKSAGRTVVLPPDYPMYAYDFVRVLARAMTLAKADRAGPALVDAMERAEVLGANGDERSFNERNHEGVVDDDIFFAQFKDMIYSPVQDDPLSASLPPIPQTR
jgi:ABC-type branched-subunit amino acid transport system substrate-binding protein